MKKLALAGVMSVLTFIGATAEEISIDDLTSEWVGSLRDFKVVEGKGIDGKSAISFKAKKKYKMIIYKNKYDLEVGKQMTVTADFKIDVKKDVSNKAFISLLVAPNIYKADGRLVASMANGKNLFFILGNLPRWTNKAFAPKFLGVESSKGESPWIRMVMTIQNQKKKVAAKVAIYSLGEDGKGEPKLAKETKMKRQTKKGDWKTSSKLTFALGSNEYQASGLNELILSNIDIVIEDY